MSQFMWQSQVMKKKLILILYHHNNNNNNNVACQLIMNGHVKNTYIFNCKVKNMHVLLLYNYIVDSKCFISRMSTGT